MLKNGERYLKNFAVFTPQYSQSMFGHFSTLCIKSLRLFVIKSVKFHCVKRVRIWSFSGTYFPVVGLNTERYSVYLRIQSKCGRIRTRKTPNTDIFNAVFKLLFPPNIQKYITSLTNPDKTIQLKLKQDLTQDDKQFLQNIEQETCCVLDLSERTLIVHSIDDLGIALAQSLLEEKLQVDNTSNIQATQKLSIITEKLKQFSYKLGYDDNDLETVVDKFYENQESLNENTLLQELTKNCPQKLERKILSNEDDSGNENESKYVNQGKLSARSSPTMKSKAEISKASTIMEPTKNGLRDIIIDGSNVAMW